LTQSDGGVALGVAADLHDLVAGHGEGCTDVGGGGGLADATLAVNRDLLADIYLDCNALFLHTRSTLGGSRTG
jgi:hypothetical protein